MYLNVNSRELATILAALRYWQSNNRQNAKQAPEYDIATDSGTLQPLGNLEIDELCERANCEPTALPGQMLSALERAVHNDALEGDDYDWVGEAQRAIDAAKAAGMEPQPA